MLMLWGSVDFPKGPSPDMPATSKIPPTTVTGDVVVANDDGESDTAETYEEELGTRDNAVYGNLKDLRGEFVRVLIEASLCDTSMIGPSGSTPTNETVVQSFRAGEESGTDA
ncbi:hypothetical protein KY284_008044 [Solanum tuberosum]|nr:hypothetical protein KY284_008044 [Solanum tuberosum]